MPLMRSELVETVEVLASLRILPVVMAEAEMVCSSVVVPVNI